MAWLLRLLMRRYGLTFPAQQEEETGPYYLLWHSPRTGARTWDGPFTSATQASGRWRLLTYRDYAHVAREVGIGHDGASPAEAVDGGVHRQLGDV